jgi:hypothetical protein
VNQSSSPLYIRNDRVEAFIACAKDAPNYR